MKRILLALSLMGALGLSLILFTNASRPTTFHVFLSAQGKDSNSGRSKRRPVLTLERAQAIIRHEMKKGHRDVIVHVAYGRYRGQVIRWSFSMPHHSITIRGEGRKRPIFDGASAKGQNTWMNIVRGDAKEHDTQNIHIRRLRVKNYWRGIRISGKGKTYQHSTGKIKISGMAFSGIGTAYDLGPKISHSAIFISSSSRNWILHNYFYKITNDKRYPASYSTEAYGGMHAIYLIRAAGTIIQKNHFKKVYARGVIKFRDFSNYGRVVQNKFYDNTSLVTASRCPRSNPNCERQGDEGSDCPSVGILWKKNQYKYHRTGIRPTLDPEWDPGIQRYCGNSRAFFRDRGLDPRDPLANIDRVPQYIKSGNRHIPGM